MLTLFRDRGVKPAALHEVRELHTALGLVVAEAGPSEPARFGGEAGLRQPRPFATAAMHGPA